MHNNNLSVYGINNNKRMWSKCNELLVRLMKDIIDLKDIGNYKDYLKEQNRKKNGKLFIIPDRIIEFITRIRSVFKHYPGHWNLTCGYSRRFSVFQGPHSYPYPEG